MGITFGDHLIDSGYHDITPEQEREIEAREECARRGLDPDDDAADGVLVWMVADQEMRDRDCPICNGDCSATPGGPPYNCPTYNAVGSPTEPLPRSQNSAPTKTTNHGD